MSVSAARPGEDILSVPSSPQLRGRSKTRGRPPLQSQPPIISSPTPSPYRNPRDAPLYRSTSLETRSRSPSPNPPTPTSQQEYYGSANLTDRSRSPSPIQSPPRKGGRRLPQVPPPAMKPASLNLQPRQNRDNMPRVMPSPSVPQAPRSPGNINFPKLNASPTHMPRLNIPPVESSPVPGRMGKPEPYSPTEKNNLNKISPEKSPSRHREREHKRDRDRTRDRSHTRAEHSPRSRSSDSRQNDRSRLISSQFSDSVEGPELSRGVALAPRTSPTVPNGYKPKGHKPEKLEMRTDSTAPLHHSDSEDDDDWC